VFAGVMTGNLTLLGLAAATRSGSLGSHVALALLGYGPARRSTTFLTGTLTAAVTGLVTRAGARAGTRWSVAVLMAHAAGASAAGGLLLAAPAALPALPAAALLAVLAVLLVRNTRPPS
jgi:uncharacterized membrane protein YoaK (UPF0700 family)